MDKYREKVENSGLKIHEDRIDGFINIAKLVSQKTGEDMELVLDMLIFVAMIKN